MLSQWLEVLLFILPEDLGLILRDLLVVHNCL